MVLLNPGHVIAQSKNENGLCARSYKKVKAQKLVKLLCQSTFSQLAKCFHDFLTDHNLLFVIGFFREKRLEKFKSSVKHASRQIIVCQSTFTRLMNFHVFHEEKRIPTFHELFNQFFQSEAKKSQKRVISHCQSAFTFYTAHSFTQIPK